MVVLCGGPLGGSCPRLDCADQPSLSVEPASSRRCTSQTTEIIASGLRVNASRDDAMAREQSGPEASRNAARGVDLGAEMLGRVVELGPASLRQARCLQRAIECVRTASERPTWSSQCCLRRESRELRRELSWPRRRDFGNKPQGILYCRVSPVLLAYLQAIHLPILQ